MPSPSDRRPPRPYKSKRTQGDDRPPPRRSGNSKFPPRDFGPRRSPPRDFQGDAPAPPRSLPGDRGTEATTFGTFIARGVRLVHEDQDVIVVDKPPGLVTADPSRAQHAAPNMRPSARVGQTLFDFVKQHVRQSSPGARRRPRESDNPADQPGRVWVIHRLDKEASGLVVFAKSLRAFESLKGEFSTKKAHRIYMAVAEGIIGEPGYASTQQSMIEEDRGPRRPPAPGQEERLGPPTKPAVTHYRVVAAANDRSLLQVRLETGRKNQIRIHMKEIGHPLVGDVRFNAKSNPLKRLGLHGAELGFTHPATKLTVRYASPAPSAFFTCVGAEVPTVSKALDVARPSTPSPDAPASPAVPPVTVSESTDREDTSWDSVAQWYDQMLEDKGNDHYENVIIPGVLGLLEPRAAMRVLDLACGQGILCRRLAAVGTSVIGVDAAPALIEAARRRSPEIDFRDHDARDLAGLKLKDLDAVTCVMALSNIDPVDAMLIAAGEALRPGGVLVACISHPAFRVPGESAWGWDQVAKRQYRRVDTYMSKVSKAIQMQPGKAAFGKGEVTTWTFHRPIGEYVRTLARAGLMVDRLEEWCSQRAASSGPRAPEENRSRLEIPLFLGIRAVKPM